MHRSQSAERLERQKEIAPRTEPSRYKTSHTRYQGEAITSPPGEALMAPFVNVEFILESPGPGVPICVSCIALFRGKTNFSYL